MIPPAVLVTRTALATTAAERWAEQYRYRMHDPICRLGTPLAVHRALLALGATPDPDAVDRVIGNGSWTMPGECRHCGADDGTPRVKLAEDESRDTPFVLLCVACVRGALAAFGYGSEVAR